MSYYDGDHPYLVEERERYEEEQRRLEQEREERRAYERRCYEENERQLAEERERYNSRSYDDSDDWGSDASNYHSNDGRHYYSTKASAEENSIIWKYSIFVFDCLTLSFAWLFVCEIMSNFITNFVGVCLALTAVLILEFFSWNNKKTSHLIVRILIFCLIFNKPFFAISGFMKWFLVFPLVCSITFFLLGKDFKSITHHLKVKGL